MILRRAYNLYLSPSKSFTQQLCKLLGFCPKNISLYHQAFQHSSSATDGMNNERLEMLGDAVLSFIVADLLFQKYPTRKEGFLTEMRSKIVSRTRMNEVAHEMNLQVFIKRSQSVRQLKDNNIMGNALEALIGAVYADKGFKATQRFILNKIIKEHVDVDLLENTEFNFKSKLLNWAQTNKQAIEFRIVEEKKLQRRSLFTMGAFINDELKGQGQHFNKKVAEQSAAEEACKVLAV